MVLQLPLRQDKPHPQGRDVRDTRMRRGWLRADRGREELHGQDFRSPRNGPGLAQKLHSVLRQKFLLLFECGSHLRGRRRRPLQSDRRQRLPGDLRGTLRRLHGARQHPRDQGEGRVGRDGRRRSGGHRPARRRRHCRLRQDLCGDLRQLVLEHQARPRVERQERVCQRQGLWRKVLFAGDAQDGVQREDVVLRRGRRRKDDLPPAHTGRG